MNSSTEIPNLVEGLHQISDDVRSSFGRLNAEQLNWKPDPDSWSVGQCLDHLIATNRPYLKIADDVLSGSRQVRVFERFPILPGLFGRLLIKALDPQSVRKLKAPARFQPSSSNLPGTIVSDFVDLQKSLAEKMEAAAGINPQRVIITSPAVSVITYSLLDAFRIIVTHERRHFAQAERVTKTAQFPATSR